MEDLSILVVSREPNFREYLSNYLLMEGHHVDTIDRAHMARQLLQDRQYDLVLLNLSDYHHGEDMLSEKEIRKWNPASRVVFLFNPDIKIAKDLIHGKKAHNCLIEPFLLDDLPLVLRRIALQKKAQDEDKVSII